MFQTKNNLPENTRAGVIKLLNERLAESIELKLRAKQAHWNVKGASFIALHELFDKLSEEADAWSDDIAERAVQLGGTAEGTLGAVSSRSKLPEFGVGLSSESQLLQALVSTVAEFGARVRAAIDESDKLGDKDSADLFTGISRGADKQLWFLESHLAR